MATVNSTPTLKDVARHLGCSTSVVSTVVNQSKGNTIVSPEMRQRVLQAAKELGYRADFASRSLASRQTRTLGLYVPPNPNASLGYSYESRILRGIEAAILEHGYDLLLLNVSGTRTFDICVDKFAERRMDGLLLLHVEPGSPWITDLLKVNANVVAVDFPHSEPGPDTVSFDNVATGKLATEYLYSLGHRKIGFVGSGLEPINFDANERYLGYQQAMRDRGIAIRPEWVFDRRSLARPLSRNENFCQLEGKLAAEHILALGAEKPTAWIAYSDFMAVHLMRHLQSAGIRLPEEMSLIGVDDSEWCELTQPFLSSVRHPLEEMGRTAANILIEKSRESRSSSRPRVSRSTNHVLFQPKIAERESTAALRKLP